MIIDNLKNHPLYERNDYWAKAFEYLRNVTMDTPDGEYELAGKDLRAVVATYKSKPYSEGVLEAHRKYYDIHYVVSGREKIYITQKSKCELDKEYNEEKDFMLFQKDTRHDIIATLNKGEFCVVSTDEAHAPSIRAGGLSEEVKKVVIKIAVEKV